MKLNLTEEMQVKHRDMLDLALRGNGLNALQPINDYISYFNKNLDKEEVKKEEVKKEATDKAKEN